MDRRGVWAKQIYGRRTGGTLIPYGERSRWIDELRIASVPRVSRPVLGACF